MTDTVAKNVNPEFLVWGQFYYLLGQNAHSVVTVAWCKVLMKRF